MPENAGCSPGGDRTISETDTSKTSTASASRSAIRRRRKLRLLCRSQNLMAVLQRATVKPARSIFIFNFAVASFTMANELEFMAACIIWKMVVTLVSWKEFQKLHGVCRQDTHSQHTSVQYSLFTSVERTPRAWLKSHGLQCHLCAPGKDLSPGVAHVSPLLVASPAFHFEHVIFLIHSSFYHDTSTRSTTGTT